MTEATLLMDVGNCRIKWAMAADQSMLAGGACHHEGLADPEMLNQIQPAERPVRVLVSNVAGNAVFARIASWSRQQFSCDAELIVSQARQHGITNAYAEPAQLGSDRWLAMIAARQQLPGYLCIVDAGSALTLDFLDPGGRHLGGYILPGLRAAPDCVLSGTRLQKNIDTRETGQRRPGDSTLACLLNGAMMSACQSIEGAILALENRKQQGVQCILTGGDSQRLSGELNIPHIIEPALVLKGLAVISRSTDST